MSRHSGAQGIAIALVAFWSLQVGALTIDDAVEDTAGVLSQEEERRVEARLVEMRDATGVQMAVLTVQTTEGEPIEDFSMRMVEAWGGGSAERDDGVLLTMAISDRRMRLEVGYGLEGVILDSEARRILDSIKPMLRGGDYAGGVEVVVARVHEEVEGLKPGEPIGFQYKALGLAASFFGPWLFFLLFVLGAFFNRKPKTKGSSEVYVSTAVTHFVAPVGIGVLVGLIGGPNMGIWCGGSAFTGAMSGGMLGEASRKSKVRLGLGGVVIALAALLLFFLPGLFPDLYDIKFDAAAGLWMFHAIGTLISVGVIRGHVKGKGGRSYGGSRSSYSSSSWSSSSSSSSSSSWSGGGGSFGGGGASSSW